MFNFTRIKRRRKEREKRADGAESMTHFYAKMLRRYVYLTGFK